MFFKFHIASSRTLFLITIATLFLSNCTGSKPKYSIEVIPNPNKIAPLTAEILISTKKPVSGTVTVLGDIPIEQSFKASSSETKVPVVGLYPGTLNKIVVSFKLESQEIIDTVNITTAPLPKFFPRIEINTLEEDLMEPGMHAADIHFANYGKFNSVPFIFDNKGKVRWYLDLSFTNKMIAPFQQLKDGSLLMVDRHVIYQYNLLGKLIKGNKIDENYGMHHDVVVLPDGNLLICVGKKDAFINVDGKQVQSDSDFIVLFDRKTAKITKEWDMATHLDVDRRDQNPLRVGDWHHMNSLDFNKKDSTIIVSGRHQGLAKISWNDELKWIMAPKKNWGKAGRNQDGADTKPFLLTAVNSEGKPYPKSVQDGIISTDDFDHLWGQHAPLLLSNGNILVFDNGILRNYSDTNLYSRAVEYKVNEAGKTFQQVWQYGKERGASFYSSIVSDVDVLPTTNNLLITSGFIAPKENHQAKIVELNKETGKEVFEATLYLKTLTGTKEAGWGQIDVVYRGERMKLKY